MKKCYALLLAIFIALFLFSGCQQGQTSSQETTGAENTSAAPVVSETTTDNKTNLVFASILSEQNNEWIKETLKPFLDSNKNYEVELRAIPFDDFNKQMSIAIASSTIPDLILLNNPDMAAYIQMGLFADITEQMNAWEDTAQFFEGPINSAKMENRYYGIPFDTNCLALFYNKTMLDEKGLTPPKTTEELRETAKKLTDKSKNVYGFLMCCKNGEEGTFQFMPFLYTFGGKYEDVGSKEAKDTLQFIVDLTKDGSMTTEAVTFSQTDVYNRFVSEQAAMMINGSWQIAGLRNEAQFEWGVALIPAGPTNISYSCLGGKILCCGNGDKVDESFEILKVLGSKEAMISYAKSFGSIPNRIDVANDPIWKEDDALAVFAEQAETAIPRGPHFSWPELSLNIRTAIGEAITGVKTVDEAFDNAQAANEPLLK